MGFGLGLVKGIATSVNRNLMQSMEDYKDKIDLLPATNVKTAQQREADYHVRSRTEKQLKEWGLKYTKLFFGKPRAKIYVDDRAINDSDFFVDKEESL